MGLFIRIILPSVLYLEFSGFPRKVFNGKRLWSWVIEGLTARTDIMPMEARFRVMLMPELVPGWHGLAEFKVKEIVREVLTRLEDLKSVSVIVDEKVEKCYNRHVHFVAIIEGPRAEETRRWNPGRDRASLKYLNPILHNYVHRFKGSIITQIINCMDSSTLFEKWY